MVNNGIFTSEDDVRAWVRAATDGRARWVEPALGSTAGLPDCWVPIRFNVQFPTVCFHLELKLGHFKKGVLRFNIRPEQAREIRAMKRDFLPVRLLIGVAETGILLLVFPTENVLKGVVDLEAEKKWWIEVDRSSSGFQKFLNKNLRVWNL